MNELPLKETQLRNYAAHHGRNPRLIGIVQQGFRVMVPGHELPTVSVLPVSNPNSFGGRYFPRHNAILLYDSHDEELTFAVNVHEHAHWMMYCNECGTPRGRSRCGYVGDHNREFYEQLGPIYRSFGVTPQTAIKVEGTYSFPREWRRLNSDWR